MNTLGWICLTAAALGAAGHAAAQDQTLPGSPLDLFAGSWRGESAFHFPRQPGRAGYAEAVTAECTRELAGRYVQCRTRWVRSGTGAQREFHLHLRHDAANRRIETVHFYTGPYDKVVTTLQPVGEAWVGYLEFNVDGVAGVERVEYRVDPSRQTLHSVQYEQLATDPSDRWFKTFEFTWRRVSAP